ncbi:MAG TPA: hypothetical protein VK638_18715, partial [Edaphobacter sp.]|nr:hypothetical protein [Edaphobacter sp.]
PIALIPTRVMACLLSGSSNNTGNPTAKGPDRFLSALTQRHIRPRLGFPTEHSFGIAVAVYELMDLSNSLKVEI